MRCTNGINFFIYRDSVIMLTYSVVICTLDRREDLKRCITSWLNQKPLPIDIIVVHGRPEGMLGEELQKLLAGSGVELCYLRMPPVLVRQRNAGMYQAQGDVVFFADDDAVYLDGYACAILNVYQTDVNGSIGGVQGTIDNYELSPAERLGLSQLFMLPRLGTGRLQSSAWPAFYRPDQNLAQVEVFSGAAMSYRKEVLQKFQFDDAFAHYWVGDDFEMAYRVSRKFKLFQVPQARLLHYPSAVGRDSIRRQRKMHVVNHYYLRRKCFGSDWKSWFYWSWSEIGMLLISALALIAERNTAYLLGMVDGYREVWKNVLRQASSDP